MHITRANPFPAFPDPVATIKRTTPSSPGTPSAPASPAPPIENDPPSFLKNFNSVLPSNTSAPVPAAPANPGSSNPKPTATVPSMPSALYSGSNGYYDATAVDARTAASNAMLAALGNNNVAAYQQAASNFLAASPAGSGLPVWASTITIDQHGNFINTNNAGVAADGTVVGENRMGYAGMMNPVPGVPNIADGTANYLGTTVNKNG